MTFTLNAQLALVIVFFLSSCTHYQPPREETNPFVGNFYQLKESSEDDLLISYWKKGVDWAGYNKIVIEPITLIKTNGSEFDQITHADAYRLTETLDFQLQGALKNNFTRVILPDEKTLILKFSITNEDKMTVLLNTFSSRYPAKQLLAALQQQSFSQKPGDNKVGIKGTILDPVTGELLMASTDSRVVGKSLLGVSDDWKDLGEAYQLWAIHLNYQLCVRQGKRNCKNPLLEQAKRNKGVS